MLELTATGNLTADPVMANTATKVCHFTLAANDRKNNATFIRCSAFDKAADLIMQYCRKGSKLFVSGRPSARAYTTKSDNTPRASLELAVNQFEFLSPKRGDADDSAYIPPRQEMTPVDTPEDLPF